MATIIRKKNPSKISSSTAFEPKEEMGELSLPTSLSVPSSILGDYVMLLYGEKKIGKTTLSSHFGKTFHMMCEPGGKALAIYQRPVRNWRELKQYVRLIAKDRSFRTVTIDTADRAYDMCSKFECARMGIDHPSDGEWGKGWSAVKNEFTSEIDILLHSGKGVILISHAQDEGIKKRSGEEFNRVIPTIPKQARGVLEAVVDIWAYYTYENGKRFLYIEGDDYIGAGHRVERHFRYQDGSPVRRIYMGRNSQEAYNNFVSAFENKLIKQEGGTQESKTEIQKPHSTTVVIKRKG